MPTLPPAAPDVDASLLPLFRSLSNPHRFHVLQAVAERPLRGKEVGETCGITPQEASRHLGRLMALGLVERGSDRAHRLTGLGRRVYEGLLEVAGAVQATRARAQESLRAVPPAP